MLLIKNGKASSTKQTKHINIRYFFITDRIAMGNISVAWCPTNKMVGDYVTKLLQGATFRKFRDLILWVLSVVFDSSVKIPSISSRTPTWLQQL